MDRSAENMVKKKKRTFYVPFKDDGGDDCCLLVSFGPQNMGHY